MMHSRFSTKVFMLLLLLSGLFCTLVQAAEVYLNVTKGGESRIRIVIPDFSFLPNLASAEKHLGREMATILSDDLRASTLFQPVDNPGLLQEIQGKEEQQRTILFTEWKTLGAQVLVKGGYGRQGDELIVECKIYDVAQTQMISGKRYRGKPVAMRTMVHKCADEIVYRFTGEQGIAQTKIAFLAPVQGRKELFLMDYDGVNIYQLTYDRSLVLSPAWSPQGKEILYTSYRAGNPDLYIMHWTGIGKKALSTYDGLNTSPAWSPDGERVALTLSKDGNPEIYTMRRDGTDLRRLTNNNALDTSPAWSPNGRQIAFTSDRSGSPQLYIMDAEGTNVRRLTYEGNYNDRAAWSPAGDVIAFTGRDASGRFNIYTISIDGKEVRQLTNKGGDNEHPTWSPDGRLIAFASTRAGISQIFCMTADGTNQRLLLAPPGGGFSPTWSPRF
jgi:TolB protein